MMGSGRLNRRKGKIEEMVSSAGTSTSACVSADSMRLLSSVKSGVVGGAAAQGMRKLVCPSCQEAFDRHERLHAHLALKHGKERIRCSQCRSLSNVLAQSHICPLCGEYASKVREHELTHYADKIGRNALLECPSCYRTFYLLRDLKSHMAARHGRVNAARRFSCSICGRRFQSRSTRDQHAQSHADLAHSNAFWQKVDVLKQHFTDDLLPHECPICRFTTNGGRQLRFHILRKHSMRDVDEQISIVEGKCELHTVELLIEEAQMAETKMTVKPDVSLSPPDESSTWLSPNRTVDFSHESRMKGGSLREQLINRCLHRSNVGSFQCLICAIVSSDLFDFELHIAADHLDLAVLPP